jgi:hypothetical protein
MFANIFKRGAGEAVQASDRESPQVASSEVDLLNDGLVFPELEHKITPVGVVIYHDSEGGNLVVRLNEHEKISEVLKGPEILPQFIFGAQGDGLSGSKEFLQDLFRLGLLRSNARCVDCIAQDSSEDQLQSLNTAVFGERFRNGSLTDFIEQLLLDRVKPSTPINSAVSYNSGVWRITPIKEVLPGYSASQVQQVIQMVEQGGGEFDDTQLARETLLVCTQDLWKLQGGKRRYNMTDTLFNKLRAAGYFMMYDHDYRPKQVFIGRELRTIGLDDADIARLKLVPEFVPRLDRDRLNVNYGPQTPQAFCELVFGDRLEGMVPAV